MENRVQWLMSLIKSGVTTLVAIITAACADHAVKGPATEQSAAGLYEAAVLKAVEEARLIRSAAGDPLPERPVLAVQLSSPSDDLVFPDQLDVMVALVDRMNTPGAKHPFCKDLGKCTMDSETVSVTIGDSVMLDDGRYYVVVFFEVLVYGNEVVWETLEYAFSRQGDGWTSSPYVPEFSIVI